MGLKIIIALLLISQSAFAAVTKTRTVKISGGDYTSLSACVNANESDFTAGAETLFVVSIEGDWSSRADSTPVVVDGSTTSPTAYITIETDATARHQDGWSANYYMLTSGVGGGAGPFKCDVDYSQVYGIQFELTYAGGAGRNTAEMSTTADSCLLAYNIIKNSGTNTGTITGILFSSNHGVCYNNFIFDYNVVSTDRGIASQTPGGGSWARIYNNTIFDCSNGIVSLSNNRVYATNNILGGCVVGANATGFLAGTGYNTTDSSSIGYNSPPATDSLDATITFVSNTDLHLDSQQHNNGTDLSAYFTDDIDGDTRSNWNRGADEIVAAGEADAYQGEIIMIGGD